MNGAEFTDLVIEHVGSELTRTKAYAAINGAQLELLGRKRLRLMRILPDPFLTTTSGTFQYAASTYLFSSVGGVKGATQWDVRDVARVYALDSTQRLFAYNGQDQVSHRPLEELAGGEYKSPADMTASRKALSADCLITFWEENDPGTTTIDWRAEAYRWPTPFTSEAVDLEVPEDWHDTLLLWKTLQRCGIKQFGSPSRGLSGMITEELPAFYKACNSGTLVTPGRTPYRDE